MKSAYKNESEQLFVKHSPEWHEGYMKLREQSSPDSKLGFIKARYHSELEIIEVTKLAEKLKWMSYFKKAYSTEIKDLALSAYDPAISRIFAAKSGNKELGFIRITNYHQHFQKFYAGEVWIIAEVFVKTAYRSQGIATQLMNQMIKHNNVKCILLETERYQANKYYFNRIGFTYKLQVNDELSRCYLTNFEEIAHTRLVEFNKSEDASKVSNNISTRLNGRDYESNR